MRMRWMLVNVLAVVVISGVGLPDHVAAVQLAASDAAGNPEPRMTPDRERDKHHGTSGMDPDSMGSSTRPMPGEEQPANGTAARKKTHHAPSKRKKHPAGAASGQ